MRKTFLLMAAMLTLTLWMAGCATLPPERSVKTYNQERRATIAALKEAKERGADEQCPAEYIAAAWKQRDADNVFWSCRTALAIEMLKEVRKTADSLCGMPAKEEEPMAEAPAPAKPAPEPMKAEPMKPAPAPAPAKPAPMVEKTWVIEDVNFDFDSANIKPGYRPVLDEAAQVMMDNPDMKFVIHGYADSIGAEAYNQKLSERRAASVKKYLVGKGVDGSRLKTVGHGERDPIAPNYMKEGRAKNRRVEIKQVK